MAQLEVNTLRKEGKLDQALILAEKEFATFPSRDTAKALFWCLNDEVKLTAGDEAKALVGRMKDIFETYDPQNEMMRKVLAIAEHMLEPEAEAEKQGWLIYNMVRDLDINEIDMRKRRIFQYLKLNLPKSTLLHSLFLVEALKMDKIEKCEFAFTKFFQLWGYDAFRNEDWENKHNKDGIKMPSNVERAITACVREMHEQNILPDDEFSALLEKAIKYYPRNNHLPRYSAQILAKKGRTDEAIKAYKSLILRLPDRFYLWDDLSELVDDLDLRLGLLCGAVTSGAQDEFLVNIRLRIADLLCNRQLYGKALTELQIYQATHDRKKWPLKRKFYNALQRIPIGTMVEDNRSLYAYYKSIAEEFLYSDIPSIKMVKAWEKKDFYSNRPTISWELRHGNTSIWFKPHPFRLDFRTPNGTIFDVKIHNDNVVWIRPAELNEDLPWLRKATGMLRIKRPTNGKVFGFVENVFIPAQLLANRNDGATTSVTAIQNEDNRWIAIAIE